MKTIDKDLNVIITRGIKALEKIGNELERQNNMNEKTLKESKKVKMNNFKKDLVARNNVDVSLLEEISTFLENTDDDETGKDK